MSIMISDDVSETMIRRKLHFKILVGWIFGMSTLVGLFHALVIFLNDYMVSSNYYDLIIIC